eukprot:m.250579 g.250579  ORF g.250579 m.250579 type:complete len:70 (-) comp17177_c0_seq7:801-1010(-)
MVSSADGVVMTVIIAEATGAGGKWKKLTLNDEVERLVFYDTIDPEIAIEFPHWRVWLCSPLHLDSPSLP